LEAGPQRVLDRQGRIKAERATGNYRRSQQKQLQSPVQDAGSTQSVKAESGEPKAENQGLLAHLPGKKGIMEQSAAKFVTITSVAFEENAYLAYLPARGDCVVFDPGLEPEKIIAAIDERKLEVVAILCTHGHADHIAGNRALKERWPDAPLIIGSGDAVKLTDPVENLSAGFGVPMTSPPADQTVSEGDVVEFAGFRFEVRETPGHSSGHVVFVALELTPIQVFGGDVLFSGSVGRTDFPGCGFEILECSIREKLYTLPDDTVVLPGHGPTTTIGEEKRTNPFVNDA